MIGRPEEGEQKADTGSGGMVHFFAAGNPAVPEDGTALAILDHLPRFRHLADPLHLLGLQGTAVILDVVKGVDSVTWLDGIEHLKRSKGVLSLHDLDLQSILHLGAAMGELPRILILAIPFGSAPADVLAPVQRALAEEPWIKPKRRE